MRRLIESAFTANPSRNGTDGRLVRLAGVVYDSPTVFDRTRRG